MRWEGISWTAGTVHVPGTNTETSNRTLKAAESLLDVLHARRIAEGRPTAGFVFHSPLGGLEDPRDYRAVARALRKALDRAGFPWANLTRCDAPWRRCSTGRTCRWARSPITWATRTRR